MLVSNNTVFALSRNMFSKHVSTKHASPKHSRMVYKTLVSIIYNFFFFFKSTNVSGLALLQCLEMLVLRFLFHFFHLHVCYCIVDIRCQFQAHLMPGCVIYVVLRYSHKFCIEPKNGPRNNRLLHKSGYLTSNCTR